jgi:predicted enzyme related to lactoylglutathione lyase
MKHGAFVWYDLATTDPEAASRFYQSVVGWTPEPVPEMRYTLLKIGETRAGGLMELPAHAREAGVPPHWSGYIGVADVDASLAQAVAAGATLRFGPEDIPGVGRFALVTDPGSAIFYRKRCSAALVARQVAAGVQFQGMSSSMRACGQPLTSLVSRSVK